MTDPRVPWQNPRILCTLLLVFLCGASAGALTVRLASNRAARGSSPAWKDGTTGKEISLDRFRRELNLTGDQAKQMESILDDFFMYYQTLQAQMDEVRGSGKSRILNILNEEQRKRFEKMVSDLQAKQIR
jgi:hypothetical protein